MTKQEKFVRDEITKVYPQLIINMKKTCGYNTPRWADDLLALSVLFFLEKPLETQLKVIEDGKLENYITFIASLQVRSGTSKFFNDYRRFTASIREFLPNYAYEYDKVEFPKPFEDEEDIVVTCIKHHMQDLNPYEKMLIQQRVIEGKTFKEIQHTFDIPYTNLKKETEIVLKKLKKLCSHLQ